MAQPNIVADMHCSNKFNFAYSFRPVYYFSRVFGFSPFTIIYDSNGKIQKAKIRMFDIIWFILSISGQILSPVFYIQNETSFSIYHISLEILIRSDSIVITMRTIFTILAIVMDMCHRHKLVEILKRIENFDDDVIA